MEDRRHRLLGTAAASSNGRGVRELGKPVALVTVADIAQAYDFGGTHPLRPERVLFTYDWIRDLGLVDDEAVFEVPARDAGDDEVLAVHDEDFVAAVKAIDAGEMRAQEGLAFGLGTSDDPIFPNMHRASAAVCGASITAAEQVVEGRSLHSFNPAGGLHHARRREASGFCIYNDPAAAIARILVLEPDWRVMYVDIDVHHGDGVQWIFYDDPRVLTVSLHQTGHTLYPGTGFEDELGDAAARGTAANIPLPPSTGDDDYLWALEQTVPVLARAFKPHVLVTQLGGDTHYGDPLANLSLTMAVYPRLARVLHETAHEVAGGRWVATGGGGYQATTVVPMIWTTHFAEMCDRADAVPEDWHDDLHPQDVARPQRDAIARSVEQVVGECLPRLSDLANLGS